MWSLSKIYLLLTLVWLSACEESKYGIVESMPTLTLTAPVTANEGEAFAVEFAIRQQGDEGAFALSMLLQDGQGTAKYEDRTIPVTGTWTTLPRASGKLMLTPTTVGRFSFSLQVRSAQGVVSERRQVTVTVLPQLQITTQLLHQTLLLNPSATTRLPINLKIAKPGYTGTYAVTVSVLKGSGKIYQGDFAATDAEVICGTDNALEYDPATLGEHIIRFTIRADHTTTTATAYLEVAKQITVESDVTESFTIRGTGRHNTEGQSVTLELVNNPRYNFEVAEWLDGHGKCLATTPTYTLTMNKGCDSLFRIKLAPRTIRLQRGEVAQVPFMYVIYKGETPIYKYVYDHKTSVFSEHNVSDDIIFYYAGSQYNTFLTPPQLSEFEGAPTLTKGQNWCGYFWRAFDDIEIYLYRTKNPHLTFNSFARYVESATTRYLIPEDIIMQ